MARTRAAAALTLLVLVTACGGGGTTADEDGTAADPASISSTPASPSTTSSSAPPSPTDPGTTATSKQPRRTGVRITTGDSAFGTMLFDANDQAIYIWEREPTARPTCYGDCATKWPPVLTDGEPVAAGQVRQGLLGTTERRDGRVQVTYNDHPLYFYADEPPGAVECHDISTHGGLWWVIQPDGDRAA